MLASQALATDIFAASGLFNMKSVDVAEAELGAANDAAQMEIEFETVPKPDVIDRRRLLATLDEIYIRVRASPRALGGGGLRLLVPGQGMGRLPQCR